MLARDEGLFRNWDRQASVRMAPRRRLEAVEEGQLLFSPDLVPVLRHPLVAQELDQAATEALLTHHLYVYMGFTTTLEVEVVNPAAQKIHSGVLDGHVALPESMLIDAMRIYIDEGYHALFCADVLHQVERATSVHPVIPREPRFMRRLGEAIRALPERHRDLGHILFAVVSETLISGKLSVLPDDARVAPTIRDVVRDHAADERRHHAYFARLFQLMWPALPPEDRRALGVLLPRFINIFLEPDPEALVALLVAVGLSCDEASSVVAETCTPEALADDARRAARATLNLFRSMGVLADGDADHAFRTEGLVG